MEFGSDFHLIKDYPKGTGVTSIFNDNILFTDGRQSLEAVIESENIITLWVPDYFCHESIAGLKKRGIRINFYPCNPLSNPNHIIEDIKFESDSAFLVMNYFGLHSKPKYVSRNCIVIEDHSHCLTSDWARNSDADWCIASLRKTLPIADGGIAWSPKGKTLKSLPFPSQHTLRNSACRYAAMKMKADFLEGRNINKSTYLDEFRVTEQNFDNLPISSIAERSRIIASTLDINIWNNIKRDNWNTLANNLICEGFSIIRPADSKLTPFSLVMLFDSQKKRDDIRIRLIKNSVYPAILWSLPDNVSYQSKDFSNKMLSIHCDARYGHRDMTMLASIINHTVGLC